jgi:hypothetical protein
MVGKHPSGTSLPKFLDECQNPRPNNYSSRDLSRALIANAEDLPYHRLSHSERELLDAPYTTHGNTARMERTIMRFLPIMSKLFFYGAVHKRVTVWFDYNDELVGAISGDWHHPSRLPSMLVKGLPPSSIRIVMKSREGSFDQRLQGYLRTLVHEMVHGFLSIYTCDCSRNGCREKNLKHNHMGKSGHGEAWANAARAIEIAASEKFGYDFDLNIGSSLCLEARVQQGNFNPTARQMEDWGITEEDLRYNSDDEVESDREAACAFICCPDIRFQCLCTVM